MKEFNILYTLADGKAVDLDRAFNIDYATAHLFLVRKAMEYRYNLKLAEAIKKGR